MNAFQSCLNTSDLIPLYLPQQLYLKPIARLNISLQLPNVKKLGKSVSHWEIMDKLRDLIKPDEFTVLKVTKTTIEFVRFQGEVETKVKLQSVVMKLNNKMIKLKDFSDLMRIRAVEWKSDFPNRQMWDDFFQNSKEMNEMKPGERPDTIHLSNLPSKWFIPYHLSEEKEVTPSENIFSHIFEKFGNIRYVDIPISDPYRRNMKDHISGLKNSSFDKIDFFEGYIQFKDYIGFTKTMTALRDMKLVHKDDDNVIEVNIKVDFDKSKHLSDASIRRREIVRDRLVKKAKEKEEKDKAELEEKQRKEAIERQREVDIKQQKELRRKLREEKRKAKILEKLEVTGTDEINEKIAKEEKKLLKVQRKLEAIRLVEELFKRIKDKNQDNVRTYDISNAANDELKRLKNTSELEVLTQREKLHHAITGRVMLKSILSDETRKNSYSSSSDSSLSLEELETKRRVKTPVLQKYPELLIDPAWLGFHLPSGPLYSEYTDFPSMRGAFPRGRMSFPRFPGLAGPSRGTFNRRRGNYQSRFRGNYYNQIRQYPSDLEDEYQKYFSKFVNDRDHIYVPRRKRSYSTSYCRRTHSRSNSSRRSRSRSYSRSRSRRRSSNRSRSRSYRSSPDRSKLKKSYSRSRSRDKSISHDRSRSRLSRKTLKKKSSNQSVTKHSKSQSREKSLSREKSVDSAAFMTPKQLLQKRSEERSRSKSWSKSPEK